MEMSLLSEAAGAGRQNYESHQQFLSPLWLKDNKISNYVHVNVTAIVKDVSILAQYPDVVVGQGYSL